MAARNDPLWAPETHYARNGDVHIAYQTYGEGDIALVGLPPIISNIEVIWEDPSARRFLLRHAEFSRMVHFDKRGQGMSDRSADVPTMDERLADLAAVMDAARVERACLAGISEGGSTAAMFAATYPDRVEKLILFGSFATIEPEARAEGDAFMAMWADGWGTPQSLTVPVVIPSKVGDEAFAKWTHHYERQSTSPGGLLAAWRWIREMDVTPVLASIQCPTLVMHRRDDRLMKVDRGRRLAELIPNARYVELDGADHMPWYGDQDTVLRLDEEFLTGRSTDTIDVDRALATVLMTDIVSSTERAVELGDAAWRQLLDRHDATAASAIRAHGGRLVKQTGDGVLAVFDAPGRALLCAQTMRDELSAMGMPIRSGVHTGEIELRGDDVGGIGVHLAARIEAKAGAGEVLASRTVRDLVAGSGFTFSSRGLHTLKGLSEEWELYAVSR